MHPDYELLVIWDQPGEPLSKEDKDFIIHAREDVPRLCRAVRELATALSAVLEHIEVDEDGLSCAIDECCAGQAALEARQVLERWQRGGD